LAEGAQPIATVQAQDTYADCTQIRAEIEGNNAKAQQLANEHGWKIAQNVGAGVAGLVIWPIWFGMDFKDAAGRRRQPFKRASNSYDAGLLGASPQPQLTHIPAFGSAFLGGVLV
jgi:hypothetical protein